MQKISNNPAEVAQYLPTQIYWHDFFTAADIDRIIQECQSSELQSPTVSHNPNIDNEVRVSNVNFHNRNHQNSWIFDQINFGIEDMNSKFFHFDLYGYDYFQYSEYHGDKSGKYNFHMDIFTNEESYASPLTRKLSLVLLLSEPGVDFEGGEFQMNVGSEDKLETLQMKKGTLIAFPSFMINRVTPVTKGTRRSIVIWVEGPKFK